MTPQALVDLIARRAAGGEGGQAAAGRLMVAIAGPPAAGKTSLAADLALGLGAGAAVVPMDGFHLDDAVLKARGHQSRKGAPHTFDVAGLGQTLRRIRAGEEVAIPVFDRALELSRAGAAVIEAHHRIILVEGNYLLLKQPPWEDLRGLFDLTLMVTAPESVLTERLIARWQRYGRADGASWIETNDLPNIRLVQGQSAQADLTLTSG